MSSKNSSTTMLQIILRQYLRNKLAVAGAIVIILLSLAAIFSPLLTRYDPDAINLNEIYQPPSWQHPFGTDMNGRDVFARVLYGARISMSVGFISSGLAGLIGVFIGAMAGFFGGK
ncbi:MAG: peptide ABC transporter permease, partial [candidate division KSB1 bacterium]|nr:peptide ABC transporter permease [candidate division KSB1 bacterium]